MDMEDTEMMAQLDQATFDEAVQSLNNAKLSVDASSKVSISLHDLHKFPGSQFLALVSAD